MLKPSPLDTEGVGAAALQFYNKADNAPVIVEGRRSKRRYVAEPSRAEQFRNLRWRIEMQEVVQAWLEVGNLRRHGMVDHRWLAMVPMRKGQVHNMKASRLASSSVPLISRRTQFSVAMNPKSS